MFATAMKRAWDQRVYIDLFASAGRSRLRETNRIVSSSPILALDVPDQFDMYIFCEKEEELLNALMQRVASTYPAVDVKYLLGDVNKNIDNIIEEIPKYEKVLSFCFVDPYKMRDIKFATIKALSARRIDFLTLIPTGMDAGRNIEKYVRDSNRTVENFTANTYWRKKWQEAIKRNTGFDLFIAELFSAEMKDLGYIYGGIDESVLIRSREKKLPLYRLGFYSRHSLGGRFWQEAKKYSANQINLFNS